MKACVKIDYYDSEEEELIVEDDGHEGVIGICTPVKDRFTPTDILMDTIEEVNEDEDSESKDPTFGRKFPEIAINVEDTDGNDFANQPNIDEKATSDSLETVASMDRDSIESDQPGEKPVKNNDTFFVMEENPRYKREVRPVTLEDTDDFAIELSATADHAETPDQSLQPNPVPKPPRANSIPSITDRERIPPDRNCAKHFEFPEIESFDKKAVSNSD